MRGRGVKSTKVKDREKRGDDRGIYIYNIYRERGDREGVGGVRKRETDRQKDRNEGEKRLYAGPSDYHPEFPNPEKRTNL